ncbi:MAG: hypothetical protein CL946_01970 [Ectothiorhodospiraceae bacterium]|nr:hypothetical protein [Ectothiorhodospiraceae bacterium]
MSTKALLCALAFLPLFAAGAQNVVTTKMEGLTHYEHKFKDIHELGTVSDPYPQVQVYCRSGNQGIMIMKLIVTLRNEQPCCSEIDIPRLLMDGKVYQSTAVTYEEFPLNEGVLETFEFYLSNPFLDKLVSSADVVIEIKDMQFNYPMALRQDYNDIIGAATPQEAGTTDGTDATYQVK